MATYLEFVSCLYKRLHLNTLARIAAAEARFLRRHRVINMVFTAYAVIANVVGAVLLIHMFKAQKAVHVRPMGDALEAHLATCDAADCLCYMWAIEDAK